MNGYGLFASCAALVSGLLSSAQAVTWRQIQLAPEDHVITSGALDESGEQVYFATAESDFRCSLENASGAIVAVRVSDFSVQERLILASSENALQTALVD